MRRRIVQVLAVLAVGCAPVLAEGQGRATVGPMIWRHGTNLKVESATDFDGSDNTAEQRLRDWDVQGSGVGLRLSYDFTPVISIYGEAGASQATVRDKDVTDPGQQVDSQGLDNGAYFGVGAQLGGSVSPKGNAFWSVGGVVTGVSTALDQDVNTSWDYDETKIAVDGKLGTWVRQVGVYGGLRVVHSTADLRETDRTNPAGQQVRTVELRRDGPVDLLIGAQTKGPGISGFTEIGLVGTFSATAGLAMRF